MKILHHFSVPLSLYRIYITIKRAFDSSFMELFDYCSFLNLRFFAFFDRFGWKTVWCLFGFYEFLDQYFYRFPLPFHAAWFYILVRLFVCMLLKKDFSFFDLGFLKVFRFERFFFVSIWFALFDFSSNLNE